MKLAALCANYYDCDLFLHLCKTYCGDQYNEEEARKKVGSNAKSLSFGALLNLIDDKDAVQRWRSRYDFHGRVKLSLQQFRLLRDKNNNSKNGNNNRTPRPQNPQNPPRSLERHSKSPHAQNSSLFVLQHPALSRESTESTRTEDSLFILRHAALSRESREASKESTRTEFSEQLVIAESPENLTSTEYSPFVLRHAALSREFREFSEQSTEFSEQLDIAESSE